MALMNALSTKGWSAQQHPRAGKVCDGATSPKI